MPSDKGIVVKRDVNNKSILSRAYSELLIAGNMNVLIDIPPLHYFQQTRMDIEISNGEPFEGVRVKRIYKNIWGSYVPFWSQLR